MEWRRQFAAAMTLWALVAAFGPPAQAQYGGGTGALEDPYEHDTAGPRAIGLRIRPKPPQFDHGSGTIKDPYQIYTAEDLNRVARESMVAHYKLMADIDLSVFKGTDFNIIGSPDWPFRGTFDGNGHTISNFTFDTSTWRDNGIGLFGAVSNPNAEIKDLRLVDPNVCLEAGFYVGAFVGSLTEGTIRDCRVEGGRIIAASAFGENVGGLVGFNAGRIINCHASCIVTANRQVGGLVGMNCGTLARWDDIEDTDSGVITDCSATGDVNGNTYVGGLAGYN